MEKIGRFNVVHRLRKRNLLIAINSVAALSIFFFGYDQGMMAGVNTAVEYYTRMGFARADENGDPVITDSLLQGGIVSLLKFCQITSVSDSTLGGRLLSRYSRWRSLWWLVRRQIWSYQVHCTRSRLGRSRSYLADRGNES